MLATALCSYSTPANLPATTALHTSNRQRVYTAPPDRNAGASQIVNVGGTLVVSFITDEVYTISDAEYTPRTSAKVMLSCAQGGIPGEGSSLWVKLLVCGPD